MTLEEMSDAHAIEMFEIHGAKIEDAARSFRQGFLIALDEAAELIDEYSVYLGDSIRTMRNNPLDRYKCPECDWIGKDEEILRAASPFAPNEIVFGCPQCKAATEFWCVCDDPTCSNLASWRTPTHSGYVHSCVRHSPLGA